MNPQVVRIIDTGQREFLLDLARKKGEDLNDVLLATAMIVDRVRREGDPAVAEFTEMYDRVKLAPSAFRVKTEEVDKAAASIAPGLASALEGAYRRIVDYHRRQLTAREHIVADRYFLVDFTAYQALIHALVAPAQQHCTRACRQFHRLTVIEQIGRAHV